VRIEVFQADGSVLGSFDGVGRSKAAGMGLLASQAALYDSSRAWRGASHR